MTIQNSQSLLNAHRQGLEALVELSEGALYQLRNGRKVIRIDVATGAQLIRDNADLLSRTLAQIAPKLLAMPEEKNETNDDALIDVDAVHDAFSKLDAVIRAEVVCAGCGLLK